MAFMFTGCPIPISSYIERLSTSILNVSYKLTIRIKSITGRGDHGATQIMSIECMLEFAERPPVFYLEISTKPYK